MFRTFSFRSPLLLWPAILAAQTVTYKPYVQPGDATTFGSSDQMVVAWQTDQASPTPNSYTVEYGTKATYGSIAPVKGRVVNNYLAADPGLPMIPGATGPKSNYYALLSGLSFDTQYFYRVTGPGLAGGFASSFHTRKTGNFFSFLVQGDEGFFPAVPGSDPPRLVNYEARIVNSMYQAANIPLPNQATRPRPDFAINTGDNVYNLGSEGSYRDYWFPVWNNNVASNETGAPFLRTFPYYIVAGNHDVGGNGDRANLLASDRAGRYSGNLDGGDALAYFNNYYFPLNGPAGTDFEYIFNGDARTSNGFYFLYNGVTYDSPAAVEAYRSSTTVNTGKGTKRQIDHMANYSFDYGNGHFIFLDANPHLFNALVDYTPTWQKAPKGFPDYPTILRDWIVNDLDSSGKLWKVAVFHQPAFSSGNATLRNFQMREIAKALEDHGVNIVFNGHEHNYQRTKPLRALAGVAAAPSTQTPPAVALDMDFNGRNVTVPDGVIYIVEGAGGNRDFDGDLTSPRGSGEGLDQEDSATGTEQINGIDYPQGRVSWLDNNLTNPTMAPFFPNAGEGPKITSVFKAKLFSFADVVVNDASMTLYQISEPLTGNSSATPATPAPFGTDYFNRLVNDPIPDTLLDPATGEVVTPPATGPHALLDKFTIMQPDVAGSVQLELSAPPSAVRSGALVLTARVTNNSAYPLNGSQIIFTIPSELSLGDPTSASLTRNGADVVATVGRLPRGATRVVQLKTRVSGSAPLNSVLSPSVSVRSGTAQPVMGNSSTTKVVDAAPFPLTTN